MRYGSNRERLGRLHCELCCYCATWRKAECGGCCAMSVRWWVAPAQHGAACGVRVWGASRRRRAALAAYSSRLGHGCAPEDGGWGAGPAAGPAALPTVELLRSGGHHAGKQLQKHRPMRGVELSVIMLGARYTPQQPDSSGACSRGRGQRGRADGCREGRRPA